MWRCALLLFAFSSKHKKTPKICEFNRYQQHFNTLCHSSCHLIADNRIFLCRLAMCKRFSLECQQMTVLKPCQEVENGRTWYSNRGLYSGCTVIQKCQMTTPYTKGDFIGIMDGEAFGCHILIPACTIVFLRKEPSTPVCWWVCQSSGLTLASLKL